VRGGGGGTAVSPGGGLMGAGVVEPDVKVRVLICQRWRKTPVTIEVVKGEATWQGGAAAGALPNPLTADGRWTGPEDGVTGRGRGGRRTPPIAVNLFEYSMCVRCRWTHGSHLRASSIEIVYRE
jgi:hypothetical protein